MTITLTNLVIWILFPTVLAFLTGWYGRGNQQRIGPRGICQETGKPARAKKCPIHGDGGAMCGQSPELVIADYRSKLAWMTNERDLYRGKAARAAKRRNV